MKFLIWVGCIFLVSVITTSIRMNGIILGAIPTVILYAGMVWLAKTLCKKWDENHNKE